MTKKVIVKHILFPLILLLLFAGCNTESVKPVKIGGNAQGTTYHITYLAKDNANYKVEVDSILKDIDRSLSTYVPTSVISRINQNDETVVADDYFTTVFNKSMEVSERTGGLFDVTIAPVINAWGFGFTKKAEVDSAMIDSLLQAVGYKMVRLEGGKVIKEKPGIMLDFNAIAQGYSVDVLASFLETKGVRNYLVELGGEVVAKGRKADKEPWKVGIDQPNEASTGERALQAVVKLENKALATSGNYRKYYEENGQKYAHTIDPRTGYPARHNLLSASVIANDCMTADAYATAFMVMGLEKSKQFLSENKALGLEAYFIYDEEGAWKTYASETLKEWMEEIP